MNFFDFWGRIWKSYFSLGPVSYPSGSMILSERLLDRSYEQKLNFHDFLLLVGSHLELVC